MLKRTADGQSGLGQSQVRSVVIEAVGQHLLAPVTCPGRRLMSCCRFTFLSILAYYVETLQ